MPLVAQRYSRCATITAIFIAASGFVFFPAATGATEASPKAVSARTYSFSIVPQHKAADLAARWVPLLQHLSARTGLHIEFRTARDIPTFEQQLTGGEYDFAYMNPFQYVLSRQKSGYHALARQRAHELRGIVVVRADSLYRTLQDLEGQVLAFPAPGAFAASILTRTQLRAEGIHTTPSFVVSHDSVYYGVVNRLFAGGGGAPETLGRLDPAVRAQLRVLWTSTEYTPHVFAAHTRVPDGVAETLRQALIETGRDPRGKQLLAAAGLQELVAANDAEYESVRKLVPGTRAALCATTESADYPGKLLCPDTFAGNETRARVMGTGNPGF
ncbi:MAG: phosphate/phosphite/phosphonate ABC transporter substrate-binding protein [Gammaproteobacteria bacterium]|nr:phosphate/phosphite/phosphonate ABC transporter substrate-binding protein [Gammaproteobacteria bacterium]